MGQPGSFSTPIVNALAAQTTDRSQLVRSWQVVAATGLFADYFGKSTFDVLFTSSGVRFSPLGHTLVALLYAQNDLPAVRRELQKDLRAFIKKVGPELGEIYTKPDLKWGDLFRMQKVGGARRDGRFASTTAC